MPSSHTGSGPATVDLLERGDALGVLTARLLTVAEESRGRFVLVRGEAGIGKTALLRQFCDDLDGSTRVLWAGCDPLFAPRPLGPLLDVARMIDGPLQAQIEAGSAPHDVAAQLLGELEGLRPTVLVIEDVHWADEATLDVLRLVSRRLRSVPALVIASYRDDELTAHHPLRIAIGDLPTDGTIVRLPVAPLSRAAVTALASGSAVDGDELFARTEGNPFFVTEALAAEAERIPMTIRDAVLARAARLTPTARAVLEAVAVFPDYVSAPLLETVCGGNLDGLRECLDGGMLRATADSLEFRHELARLAVVEAIAPDRALTLHRRALATLIASGEEHVELMRICHHAEAAADADAVLRYAPAAAERASALGAHRDAAALFGCALRFMPGNRPARAALLQRFAEECYLTDVREAGLAALDEALAIHRRLGSIRGEGEVQQSRARLLLFVARVDEAREAARQAVVKLERLPAGPELARAYGALAEIALHCDEQEATIRWGRLAVQTAETVGDVEGLAYGLISVGTMTLARGANEGLAELERGLQIARDAGLVSEAGRAFVNLAAACALRRDWTLADRYIAAGIDYCRAYGLESMLLYMLAAHAESHLMQGRWSDAAEHASAVLGAPNQSMPGPRNWAQCTLALVRMRRGDPGYWELLDAALVGAREIGELQYQAPVAAARAEALWLEGRSEAIAAETDSSFELARQLRQPMQLGQLAVWRWRAGLLHSPPAGIEDVARMQIGGQARQAAQRWREFGLIYDSALALTDSQDPVLLREGLEALRILGAKPAVAIVARRLRELGERRLPCGPRAQTRANPGGLTARELEILALLVEGLRNATIAQRTFLSARTVEHHASSIYRKLGVSSRAQAVALATATGLLDPS